MKEFNHLIVVRKVDGLFLETKKKGEQFRVYEQDDLDSESPVFPMMEIWENEENPEVFYEFIFPD